MSRGLPNSGASRLASSADTPYDYCVRIVPGRSDAERRRRHSPGDRWERVIGRRPAPEGAIVSGTRIASVSGLRGVVGDGLDPAIVVEFAAAYASGCGPGPIVVGHDGRVSAPVFVPAVLAGVTATGRDALLVGAGGHADARPAGPRPGGGRRDPDLGLAQPAEVQRPEVLPARGDGPRPGRGPGGARPARAPRVRLGGVGRAWAGSGTLEDPDAAHLNAGPQDRRRRGDPPPQVLGRARRLPRRGRPAGGGAAPGPGVRGGRPRAACPTAGTTTRPSRPRPTSGPSPRSSRPPARRSGSPRTPTPTGWRSSTRPAATSARS